jgi:aspartyl-tRNA(Asn)/glutamyl-tRNA(Gln) amidotransferase subunit B
MSNTIISATGKVYYPVIGLEIHAELKTKSKMFCACRNNPDEESPNKNICAVCMGHPGTLPVLNKEAIRHVIRVGTSVGADIADYTEWDRKNYFYPDIPKGYQISQFAYPLVKNGSVKAKGVDGEEHEVKLTRIHLEEDTAKSSHDKGDYSLVDFNRAGLPLMELVTEPVIHDAKTAANFAKELQLLLRTLGAGDANMEKGEMRVEANISISENPKAHEFPYDVKTFGRKVEVKNLNSFRSVERAIEFELQRHMDMLDRGEVIVQETRGFDETTGKTFSQRAKEDSHDYRYFPDPDLPKLFTSEIPEFNVSDIKKELPMLPWERRFRYKQEFSMKDEDAEMFVQNEMFRDFFEGVASLLDSEKVKLAVNYITSDIAGLIKKAGIDEFKITPTFFAQIMTMISVGELSSRGAKDILAIYWNENIDMNPKVIAEERGMIQKNDPEALKKMIQELIDQNPTVVADYKAGKQASLQFFIGQIMKISKGSINPQVARDTLLQLIDTQA